MLGRALENAPHRGARCGQFTETAVNLRSDHSIGIRREELLDVPSVLTASSIELQQHEICRANDGNLAIGTSDALSARQDGRLPAEPANDDIDRTLAGTLETDDSCQRVRIVASTDVDRR